MIPKTRSGAVMADNFDFDDFELDEGADFGMDDEGNILVSGGSKKDRSPVETLSKSALSGAKDTAMSPEFRKRMIRESLPEGYSVAYDSVDNAIEVGRNLYDTTAQELAPARKSFQKITKRLLPNVENFLPKGIAERLSDFANDTSDADNARTDWREQEITSQLSEIFETQMLHEQQLASDDDNKEVVRELVENKRHKSTVE
jgi:hypothetical protein